MDVTQLQHAARPAGRQLVSGVVAQPAPASPSSEMFGSLPSVAVDRTIGPCRWTAHGTSVPALGAEVLLAFDEQGIPVVVWWDSGSDIPGLPLFVGAGGVTPKGNPVPPFGAHWTNASGPYQPAFFYRDLAGAVHVEGHATPTGTVANGDVIFVLPAEFRPTRTVTAAAPGTSPTAFLTVDNTGSVRWNGGTLSAGALVPLYGLTFLAI